jgi:Tol biopolymer transport system component
MRRLLRVSTYGLTAATVIGCFALVTAGWANAHTSAGEAIPSPDASFKEPAWAPNGKQLAFVSNFEDVSKFGNVFVMQPDGTGTRQVTNDLLGKGEPSWSPNGQAIAYHAFGYIDVVNADGSNHRRLWSDAALDHGACCAAWSPGGRKIAFVFARAGQQGQLWMMNADGSGKRRLLVPPKGRGYTFPTWSPDGKWLAFTYSIVPENGSARGYLGIVRSTGRGPIRKIRTGRYAPWQPDWSRDGSKVVISENEQSIAVVTLRTGKVRHLHEGTSPSWSPNGRRIAFDCGSKPTSAIYRGPGRICVMNSDGSHVREVMPDAAS